jgi:hypothetical protein
VLSAKFTNNLFRNAIAIHVSGIDEATATFVIQIELVSRFMDVGVTTPGHSS